MEGMAAGLPIVATDIAANRELVVPDETGFLVPVGDAVGFMQFTRRLIDEPGLRAALGAAGRERMRSEFSVAKMIERYADLYRRVVSRAE
jgi:glycosyltransferase involved in cell wall biosynthesis